MVDWICSGEPFNGEFLSGNMPEHFALNSPSPNPFNPSTTLTYSLPASSEVSLIIYDLQGRLVTTLDEGFRQPGTYQTVFDASNLASGIYFATLKAGNFTQTHKLVLMK